MNQSNTFSWPTHKAKARARRKARIAKKKWNK